MAAVDERNGGDGGVPVRDAACLILIDRSGRDARLLLGRRLASQVFLPNKWVFPGGRVDETEHDVLTSSTGRTSVIDGHLPFVRAAIRETYEEAGLAVGAAYDTGATFDPLDRLTPLARAITPPGLPRRFDTWFYTAEWDCSRRPTGTPDGELLDIAWFTLAEVQALDLPHITRLIVDDVATAIDGPAHTKPTVVPFYFQAVDGYERTLISPTWPWPQP